MSLEVRINIPRMHCIFICALSGKAFELPAYHEKKKMSPINNVQLLHAEVLADCRLRQEVAQ